MIFWLTVLDLIKFIIFLLLFVFVPGSVVLSYLNIKQKNKFCQTILSFTCGFVIFVFLSFWLNILSLRFLVIPILLSFFILFLKNKQYKIFSSILSILEDKRIFIIIILGVLFQSSLLLKSGTEKEGNIVFWGVHGYDGIWHSALISELSKDYPYQSPGFAGFPLKNYHYLTDFFLAQIHFYTKIPILTLYFKFSPVFFSFLLNCLAFLFAFEWSHNKKVGLWSVFFVSFANSFGWILPFFKIGSNNWETAFWAMSSSSAFLNPPLAISFILILTICLLLNELLLGKSKKIVPLIAIFISILSGVKAYGAIIILVVIGILGIYEILFKKEPVLLWMFILSVFLSFLIFRFMNIEIGNSFFVLKPWWFIRTMIEAPDRVNWVAWEMRRQVYTALGEKYKLILLEFISLLIFIVGNLGTRFLGFFPVVDLIKKNNFLNRFFLVLLPISFLPPLLFVQKGVAWNSIQFIYYFIFFFSFLSAKAASNILDKIKFTPFKVFFTILLIGISIPSSLKTFWWYNAPVPTVILNKEEKQALDFLKKQEEGVVLTYPFQEIKRKEFLEPPVPLTYYNSPYVSFFSNKRSYLEDQNSALILDYPLEERLNKVNNFFSGDDLNFDLSFLNEEKIRYIYLVNDQEIFLEKYLAIQKIFDNGKVRIFKVNGLK